MEIAVGRLLPPLCILFYTAKGVIHTLLTCLFKGIPIWRKHPTQIKNIIIFRNIVHRCFPGILPTGSQLYIILQNEIILNIGGILGKLPPKSKMTERTSRHCLFPEKVIGLQKPLNMWGELQRTSVNRRPTINTPL